MVKRIITGLILVTIGGLVVYFGGLFYFLWVALGTTLVTHELFSLAARRSPFPNWMYVGYAPVLLALWLVFQARYFALWTSPAMRVLVAISFLFYFAELASRRVFASESVIFSWLRSTVLISLTAPFAYLVRAGQNGVVMCLFCMFAVAASDSFAYFVGKRFGKHKLTKISPNKTIEGSLGGLAGSVVVSSVFLAVWSLFSDPHIAWPRAVLYALLISIFSQLGDLHESLTKRQFNVKDSSHILPGHGGIYDRADGYIFVMPLVFYLLN